MHVTMLHCNIGAWKNGAIHNLKFALEHDAGCQPVVGISVNKWCKYYIQGSDVLS